MHYTTLFLKTNLGGESRSESRPVRQSLTHSFSELIVVFNFCRNMSAPGNMICSGHTSHVGISSLIDHANHVGHEGHAGYVGHAGHTYHVGYLDQRRNISH